MNDSHFKFSEWTRYADEDLTMAELALKEKGPANQICFHCQQAAEKYLKGFLVLRGEKFEKSHQLRYLLEKCVTIDSTFQELQEEVILLTQFYIETRYPGDIPYFSRTDAQAAHLAAERIKSFVLAMVQ